MAGRAFSETFLGNIEFFQFKKAFAEPFCLLTLASPQTILY